MRSPPPVLRPGHSAAWGLRRADPAAHRASESDGGVVMTETLTLDEALAVRPGPLHCLGGPQLRSWAPGSGK